MLEEKIKSMPHTLTMNSRKDVAITGVTDIDSFDEETVALFTENGELIIRGTSLHIGKIDVDSGNLTLDGQINSIEYSDNIQSRGNIWSRLFR